MAKPQLRKPKKKIGPVKAIRVGTIDYKDTATLRKFIFICTLGRRNDHATLCVTFGYRRQIQ